jgi:hypothetical protein
MVIKLIDEKKGWIRILEAVIAILLLSSVLIYVTVKNQADVRDKQISERAHNLAGNILQDVSYSDALRNATLNSNYSLIIDYISSQVGDSFNYSVSICDLNSQICPPSQPYSSINTKGDVYVENVIISSTLDTYDPKILRLYLWKD